MWEAAALKHCDGSELSDAEKDDLLPPDAQHPDRRGGMVRVDAQSLSGLEVDWGADGVPEVGLPPQDINFNGVTGALNPGLNDWAFVATSLNQFGAGRNVGGLYIDALGRRNMGPLSLDVGRGDIGRGDIGRGDIGRGDIGRGRYRPRRHRPRRHRPRATSGAATSAAATSAAATSARVTRMSALRTSPLARSICQPRGR